MFKIEDLRVQDAETIIAGEARGAETAGFISGAESAGFVESAGFIAAE